MKTPTPQVILSRNPATRAKQKISLFGAMYGNTFLSGSPQHFGIFRTMRKKRRLSVAEQVRQGEPGAPDSLCATSQRNDKRTVEEFIHLATADLDSLDLDRIRANPLCDRCVFLFNVARANKLPLRHQNLDQLVNQILAAQKDT